jgi:hypothetical protein
MQVRKRVVVTAGEKGQKTASSTSPVERLKITYEIIEHKNIKNSQEHEPVKNGDKSTSFSPHLNAWTEEDDRKTMGKAFQASIRL